MTEPKWLLRSFVMTARHRMLSEHGGVRGVHGSSPLQAILSRCRQKPRPGASASIYDIAAAYAFGIAKNHPFIDGNKRTAFVAAAVFLQINGLRLEATEVDAVIATRELAAGSIGEKQFSDWLAQNCVG